MVILSFSNWSVDSVVLSKFCIVQLISCKESILSSSSMSSHLVKSMIKLFPHHQFVPSTEIFPMKFSSVSLTSKYFPVIGNILLMLINFLSVAIIITGYLVFTITSPSVASIFVMLIWFLRLARSFVLVFMFIGLSLSLSSLISGSIISLISCCLRCLNL